LRLEARMKLGYYPLPPAEGDKLRKMLQFPSTPASVIDPCAGKGAALLQLTSGADAYRCGVELDADRAGDAQRVGIDVIHGNLFDATARSGQFSLLYLNPPYDSETGSYGNQRMEFLFLEHTFRWLQKRGILLMVIPFAAILPCVGILATHFKGIQVFRLEDPEAEKYDQVAIFGIYDRVSGTDVQNMTSRLRYDLRSISQLPVLNPAVLAQYVVPPSPRASVIYKGLPLDEVEDRLIASPSWENISSFFTPGLGVEDGRPLTPLHAGHVGLMCTSGLMNGVLGEGDSRHIAQWRSIKHIDESVEEDENGSKIVKRSERFSTELACVYSDGRVYLLTETPKDNPEIT
jgi:hypothetical protein